MSEWHYSSNGQQLGPVTSAQLKQLVGSGQLQATDMVWKDGMADWAPAGRIKGLFDGGAAARPAGAATAVAAAPAAPGAYAAPVAQDRSGSQIGYYNPSAGLGERVAKTLKGFPPPSGMQGEWPMSELQLEQLKEAEKQRKAIRSCAGLFTFLGALYAIGAVAIGLSGLFMVNSGPRGSGITTWASGAVMGVSGVMAAFAVLAFFARRATLRCRIWAPITFIALFSIGVIMNFAGMAMNSGSGPGRNSGGGEVAGGVIGLLFAGALIMVCVKGLVAIPKFLACPLWAQEALVNAKL
ncbi:MAG: hypothetical protein JWN40_2450 [Phycisphaerales bacterium]|nr:hypothetical protein [Phycisphaerales bacterium]